MVSYFFFVYPFRTSFLEALAFWQIIRTDFYDIHANKVCGIDALKERSRENKRRQMCKEGGGNAEKRGEELTRRETERGRRSSRGGGCVEEKDDGEGEVLAGGRE